MRRILAPLLLLPLAHADAATLRVPSEYATINAALDASTLGDTVLVAPGHYSDAETRTIPWNGGGTATFTALAFLRDGVVLASEGGSAVTTLDLSSAAITGGAAGVVGQGLASGATEIRGFTLLPSTGVFKQGFVIDDESTHVTIADCVVDGFSVQSIFTSAGVAFAGTSLTLESCVFRNCRAGAGAVFELRGTDLLVIDSVFESNESTGGGSGAIQLIGGVGDPLIYTARFEGCSFVNNSAGGSGGAAIGKGGFGYQAIELVSCLFLGNESVGSGGAVSIGLDGASASAVVSDCLFGFNVSTGVGTAGGAILIDSFPAGGSASLRNCTFVSNASVIWGGAVTLVRTQSALQNNAIAHSASSGAAVRGFSLASMVSECNVFWDNSATDVDGFTMGATDRVVDPQFCDPERGDFSVRLSSPCIEPGSLGCGQIGAFGEGCGPLSIESASWARIKAMFQD